MNSNEEVNDSYSGGEDERLTGLARIPNEEVRSEFERILRKAKHKSLIELVRKSDQLLEDTIGGNEREVARAIQEVHDSEYAPNFYNEEQSLRSVIRMACISAVDQYARVEEMSSGHGMADVVFIPNRRSSLPAMIVELKWNRSGEGVLRQIQEKRYPKALEKFGGRMLLVGVNYDEKTKEHSCRILEQMIGDPGNAE